MSDSDISCLLSESELVGKLTGDFIATPLFAVFRIIGLSEIPYIERLPYTRNLIDYINGNLVTTEGFSCLGGVEEIVPCYNAMLLEAYCRLGLGADKEASLYRWKRQLASDPDCAPLLRLIQEKRTGDNQWKVDYIYNYKGYIGFDTRRKASEWISALLPLWLYGV